MDKEMSRWEDLNEFFTKPYDQLIERINREACMSDNINSPRWYQGSDGSEVIDVIEAFDLGFNLGNVLKYVVRSGRKGDAVEDLRKAVYYLNREIAAIEAAKAWGKL